MREKNKHLINFLTDSPSTIFFDVSVTKGVAEDEEAIFNPGGDGNLHATITAENDDVIIETNVILDSSDYYLKKDDSLLIEIPIFDLQYVSPVGEKYLIRSDMQSYIFTDNLEKH